MSVHPARGRAGPGGSRGCQGTGHSGQGWSWSPTPPTLLPRLCTKGWRTQKEVTGDQQGDLAAGAPPHLLGGGPCGEATRSEVVVRGVSFARSADTCVPAAPCATASPADEGSQAFSARLRPLRARGSPLPVGRAGSRLDPCAHRETCPILLGCLQTQESGAEAPLPAPHGS